MKTLSVIVPVYNLQDYIEECIQSILTQTYQELELLLILNGSTDGSGEICEKYAKIDRRICIMNIQENNGVFPAWYLGVLSARGDYTTFVDGDDYVDPDYFENILSQIDGHDMVATYSKKVTRWSKYLFKDRLKPGEYSTPDAMNNIVFHMFEEDYLVNPVPLAKAYRTPLLKTAMEEINHVVGDRVLGWPDYAIVFTCLLKCNSLSFVELYGYNYRIRSNSFGHSKNPNALVDLDSFYKCMKAILESDARSNSLVSGLEMFIQERLLLLGAILGFSGKNWIPAYFMPFAEKIKGARVVLYSATEIGFGYYKQIQRESLCDLALWVSRNWEGKRKIGLSVNPVEELITCEYDWVIIAVKSEMAAKSIIQELIELGVDREKILWERPAHLLH